MRKKSWKKRMEYLTYNKSNADKLILKWRHSLEECEKFLKAPKNEK